MEKSENMVNVKSERRLRDKINELADRDGRKRYTVQNEAVRLGLDRLLADVADVKSAE